MAVSAADVESARDSQSPDSVDSAKKQLQQAQLMQVLQGEVAIMKKEMERLYKTIHNRVRVYAWVCSKVHYRNLDWVPQPFATSQLTSDDSVCNLQFKVSTI